MLTSRLSAKLHASPLSGVVTTPGRQTLFRILIVQAGQGQVFNVVLTAHASSSFAGSLNCRQEKRNENANNRDDDQQFDERKRPAISVSVVE